jgi:hypothetical protein
MIATMIRWLLVAVGLLAYYVGMFLYEDEEGVLQNRIENLWIAIDDRARYTGSATAALFEKVALIVSRILNRIYGRKLISLHVFRTSLSFSTVEQRPQEDRNGVFEVSFDVIPLLLVNARANRAFAAFELRSGTSSDGSDRE